MKDLPFRIVGISRPPVPTGLIEPAVATVPDSLTDGAQAVKVARKMERSADTRLLDSWERYRALVDLLEHHVDLSEIADRRTRFALIIMGSLNAFSVLVVARPELFGSSVAPLGGWLVAYLVAYAVLSGYLFVHAINTLRPRAGGKRGLMETDAMTGSGVAGLRFAADVLACTPDEYYRRWTTAKVGELSAEVAAQVQVFARINTEKYEALDRVYRGLVALTILSAALITVLAGLGLHG